MFRVTWGLGYGESGRGKDVPEERTAPGCGSYGAGLPLETGCVGAGFGHVGASIAGALEGGCYGVLGVFGFEVVEGDGDFVAGGEFDCEVSVWGVGGYPHVVADVEDVVGGNEGGEVGYWCFCVAWSGGVLMEFWVSDWVVDERIFY